MVSKGLELQCHFHSWEVAFALLRSTFGSQHLRSAQDFMKVGDEVEAVILTLDRSRWDNYTEDSTMKLLHYGKSETRQLRLNVTYTFGKSQQSHQGKLDALDRL